MSQFRICDDVNWEVSNGQSGVSRFSEAALADPRHSFLFDLVRSARVSDIVAMLGETIGRGKFGVVKSVADAPHLVAKLHPEPFTNTALNVALETGLPRVTGSLDLTTPRYIGFIQGFEPLVDSADYTALTLMSKIEGTTLSAYVDPEDVKSFNESAERREMIRIASEAVGTVGIDPDIAYWPDVHIGNLMVSNEVQTLDEAYRSPIAVIDIPTSAWANSFRTWQQ